MPRQVEVTCPGDSGEIHANPNKGELHWHRMANGTRRGGRPNYLGSECDALHSLPCDARASLLAIVPSLALPRPPRAHSPNCRQSGFC